MDLALKYLHRLIFDKIQPTNPPTNHCTFIFTFCVVVSQEDLNRYARLIRGNLTGQCKQYMFIFTDFYL